MPDSTFDWIIQIYRTHLVTLLVPQGGGALAPAPDIPQGLRPTSLKQTQSRKGTHVQLN